jgi:hypothetical protein
MLVYRNQSAGIQHENWYRLDAAVAANTSRDSTYVPTYATMTNLEPLHNIQ